MKFLIENMKTIRLVSFVLFSLLIIGGPAYAQQGAGATQPKPAATVAPVPVGFINTQAFDDEKLGITRYVNALKSLNTEFAPSNTELQNMATRITTLQTKLQGPNPTVADREEFDKLQREFKFKQENGKAAFQKRYNEVIGPIMQDIGNELTAFARQNGIKVLLDISKIFEAVLVYEESADMTKAFIAFYNAKKPATGATTTTPTTTPVKRP